MPSNIVYSDYLEVNRFLETIKREDLVERQRTVAKRRFCRSLTQELEDDIDSAKPLLANRDSVKNQFFKVVWRDELGERISSMVRKAGELARIWREICRTRC